jgi:hypothetical protein
VSVREPVIVDCGCGRDHPSMPTENGVDLICRTHKRHHPCRKCAHERKAPPVSVREQAIEAAEKAIAELFGAACVNMRISSGLDFIPCGTCTDCKRDWTPEATLILRLAVPALLNDLADRIEQERLTGNVFPEDVAHNAATVAAAALVRAAAEGWTE